MIKLGTVGIRFIWNWDLESSLLRYVWNNRGILGILSGLIILGESLRISILVLKMGEGLSIVRILVLREMEDLKVSILRMMWCLTRRGGVTGIGGS